MRTIQFACVLVWTLGLAGCGDDAAPGNDAGSTCSSDMYDTYGQAGFEAVVDEILVNIGTVSAMNPSPIGDSFKGLTPTQVAAVENDLLDFLIFVYGGPNNYGGRTMEAAHAGLGITQAEYDAFVSMVIVPALTDSGVSEAHITECFAPPVVAPDFVASIVGR
jgi:hypothetical protein